MALEAVNAAGLQGARSDTSKGVLPVTQQPKVDRVDAATVSADVVDFLVTRNRPERHLVGEAVRQYPAPGAVSVAPKATAEDAVSAFPICRREPGPTATGGRLVDLRPESAFSFRIARHAWPDVEWLHGGQFPSSERHPAEARWQIEPHHSHARLGLVGAADVGPGRRSMPRGLTAGDGYGESADRARPIRRGQRLQRRRGCAAPSPRGPPRLECVPRSRATRARRIPFPVTRSRRSRSGRPWHRRR